MDYGMPRLWRTSTWIGWSWVSCLALIGWPRMNWLALIGWPLWGLAVSSSGSRWKLAKGPSDGERRGRLREEGLAAALTRGNKKTWRRLAEHNWSKACDKTNPWRILITSGLLTGTLKCEGRLGNSFLLSPVKYIGHVEVTYSVTTSTREYSQGCHLKTQLQLILHTNKKKMLRPFAFKTENPISMKVFTPMWLNGKCLQKKQPQLKWHWEFWQFYRKRKGVTAPKQTHN